MYHFNEKISNFVSKINDFVYEDKEFQRRKKKNFKQYTFFSPRTRG